MTGRLTVVPTPIGNLKDMTERAIASLREADIVYAEDTRRTGILLAHLGISKPLRSLFIGNEHARSEEALSALDEGKALALCSDAGTPGIADPGAELIRSAVNSGHHVEVLPGPQAILPALLLSGLPPVPFTFVGFLPRKAAARRAALRQFADLKWSAVIYEAPHRLESTLRDALEILGDRPAAIARELTKVHEEVLRGNLKDLLERQSAAPLRGEIVLVVGRGAETAALKPDLAAFVSQALGQGSAPAEIGRAARAAGLRRADAYREALRQKEKAPGPE